METLSDLLTGNQGQGGGLQQTGAQDPGYEQRKTGWKQSLDAMIQDPVNAMMMLQFGSSLANIQSGQNVGAAVSNAFTDAFAMRGRYEQILRDRQAAEQEAAQKAERFELDKQRVGYEGERLNLSREELAQRRADAEAERKLKEKELGIREQDIQTRRSGDTKPSEIDKLTDAIAEARGLDKAQARILATRINKNSTMEDKLLDLTKELAWQYDTVAEAQAAAEQIIQGIYVDDMNDQVPTQDLSTHPGWAGIPPGQKAEMEKMAREMKGGPLQLLEFLELRANGGK